jgi:hypothetical protein
MRRLAVLLVSGLSVLSWFPASATAGGPMGMRPRMADSPKFLGSVPRGGTWPAPPVRTSPYGVWGVPLVRADPYVVIVPVPVATPVQVIAAPPAPHAAPPPPPPEPVARRPVVVNPGPKIIEIVPPPPDVRTVDIVVVRGSTTSVEKVPVQ